MNTKELHARAKDLKITVPEGATNKDIENLIKVAEHPLLTEEVKTLGVSLKETAEAKSALEGKIDEANSRISALELQLENSSNKEPQNKSNAVTYKNGKDTYVFTVPKFRFKGDEWTAENAIENDALMKQLIKAKFSNLKKQ